MISYNLLICFIIFLLELFYSFYNISYRKHTTILIVNCINLVASTALFILELMRYFVDYSYNNGYLTDIIVFISISNLLNSILVKRYQEIDFNYNFATLSVVFATLTIILCLYMCAFSKMGDFTFEGFVLYMVATFIYFLSATANIYLTKQVEQVIENNTNKNISQIHYNNTTDVDKIFDKEVVVVRQFTTCNITATYIKNRDYKVINKRSYYTIFYYYLMAILITIF